MIIVHNNAGILLSCIFQLSDSYSMTMQEDSYFCEELQRALELVSIDPPDKKNKDDVRKSHIRLTSIKKITFLFEMIL